MAEEEREAIQTTTSNSTHIESRIKDAMRSRISHFRDQSDSLTFEGVRRLLEKDLGMEKFSLDVHRRLVNQLLFDSLNLTADNLSKDAGETKKKDILIKKEATKSPEEGEPKTDVKDHSSEEGDKMEDSPVMGLLTEQRKSKQETEESEGKENKVPNETMVKKALWKRASYIKANSEKVTMAGLRRLLEEDLKLEKYSLDTFKKFVSQQLDKVLISSHVTEPKKRDAKKNSHGKASVRKVKNEESDKEDEKSDEEDEDNMEEEEEEEPKKKSTKKVANSEKSKKRKLPEKEMKALNKKRRKPAEKVAEDASDADESENEFDDSRSEASAPKSIKKKEAPTPAFGKCVEHLKSIIKSCSMSVPPSIYKRVKQVPENKREAQLIKELEEILSREGLSSSPTEKEITDVRRRKERAKELEGIDMSNIVSSTRRRCTNSYVAPPKPKVPVETDDLADDSEEDDEDAEEADENVDDDAVENDGDGDDDSESEEVDGGLDEDSD